MIWLQRNSGCSSKSSRGGAARAVSAIPSHNSLKNNFVFDQGKSQRFGNGCGFMLYFI